MATVQRLPARHRAASPRGRQGRPQAAQGQGRLTLARSLGLCVGLTLLTQAGCVTRTGADATLLANALPLATGLVAGPQTPLPEPRPVPQQGQGQGDVAKEKDKAKDKSPRELANESADQLLKGPDDPPPIVGTPVSAGGPLSLEEVLISVERHYPLLRAVELERALAGGRLLSTYGAFDFNLNATLDGQGTTYDNVRHSVGLSQGLPVAGAGVFAGYRQGVGDFPTYLLGQKTADGGEFRAGFSLPLLRGREIDIPRAAIQQATIDVAIAEPLIERQRLDLLRAAGVTYWRWVAAGVRVGVVKELVELAAVRDEQIQGTIREGRVAAIERVDNQQNIALRNGILVRAERDFQQATIDLSLFYRDDSGTPNLAPASRLPKFPEVAAVDPAKFPEALSLAFQLRPEPRRLRMVFDRTQVDLALALNQTLPELNATALASQDVGPGKSTFSGVNGLERTTLSAGLAFALPVQRRIARGRAAQAQARLTQITQELRQAEDVVRADVQNTFSALERAYEFYEQAKSRVALAEQVADAERRRQRGGNSTILLVTLREQVAFEARIIAIDAQQDYFRALTEFRAALGIGGRSELPPAK